MAQSAKLIAAANQPACPPARQADRETFPASASRLGLAAGLLPHPPVRVVHTRIPALQLQGCTHASFTQDPPLPLPPLCLTRHPTRPRLPRMAPSESLSSLLPLSPDGSPADMSALSSRARSASNPAHRHTAHRHTRRQARIFCVNLLLSLLLLTAPPSLRPSLASQICVYAHIHTSARRLPVHRVSYDC